MTGIHLAIFRGKQIRRVIYHNEWWFSVVDVIAALTDSVNPRDYWYKMKIRVKNEDRVELSTFCRQQNKQASKDWGAIAGNARHQLEQKSGQKVSTPKNYLNTYQSPKFPKR